MYNALTVRVILQEKRHPGLIHVCYNKTGKDKFIENFRILRFKSHQVVDTLAE